MADQDVKDEISEDELDQIIQDMSKEEEAVEEAIAPVAEAASAPAAKPILEVVQGKKAAAASASAPQALTLEMNGTINLKLTFKSGDRSIDVVCGEDALVCTLADGTEFRIPTGIAKVRKAG